MQPSEGRTRAVLRFGLFELAPETGELRKAGRPVRLQPQPSRVLAVLAGRAGELVTREELHREVWGEGTHVDLDQGINFSIRQIRAALGDSAEAPVYVETVPRRGYRFLAPVETIAPAEPAPVLPRRRLPLAVFASVFLLLVLAAGLLIALVAARRPRTAAPVVSPAAREAYLTGRYLLDKKDRTAADAEKSVALFEQAVASEPSYAEAWAGLADALAVVPRPPRQAIPRARAAALRALELDPGLAAAHHRLAGIHLYYDWDWEAARREYERAIELDPGSVTAHHSFAAYFSILGRHGEALARMERARELDPVSASINGDIGWYFYFARRYGDAVRQSLRTLELEPGHAGARTCLLYSHLLQGDLPAARERVRELMAMQGAAPEALAALDRGPELDVYWRWTLEELTGRAAREHVSPVHFALARLSLGDREAAFRELERAYRERSGWLLPFLAVEPRLDPLRRDPRYADLLRRLRLPPS
jgi:DNA-binding winged helix-turn-helix (wHTH) protein/tetratricopeptide (TPR) repeat protein